MGVLRAKIIVHNWVVSQVGFHTTIVKTHQQYKR